MRKRYSRLGRQAMVLSVSKKAGPRGVSDVEMG
jgi:hypothetical protein